MTNTWINPGTPVGEAVERVPGAEKFFLHHGVDPTTACARKLHEASLADAAEHCGLRDVSGLTDELNAILMQVILRSLEI